MIALVTLQEEVPALIWWGLLSVWGHIVQVVLAGAVTRHSTGCFILRSDVYNACMIIAQAQSLDHAKFRDPNEPK